MSIYIAHNRTVHALTMPNVHSSNVIHIAQLITVTFESRRRIQYCNPRPPVFVRQRPGLPGRRLSARRRRPCQTTAFCWHSNTRCQSDPQQFRRQDLCRRRTTSLEQFAIQWLCGLSYGQFMRLLKTFFIRTFIVWHGHQRRAVDFSSLSRFRRSLCKIDFSEFLTVQ